MEESTDTYLGRYRFTPRRKDSEVNDMRLHIEAELFNVLTSDERKNFVNIKLISE